MSGPGHAHRPWSDVGPHRMVAIAALAAVVVLAAGLAMASPTVATSGPLVVGVGLLEWQRRTAVGRARRSTEVLPSIIDRLIQQLRSGASLRQACVDLGDPNFDGSASLEALTNSLGAGHTLVDAAKELLAVTDPEPVPSGPWFRWHRGPEANGSEVRLVATTLLVLAENGGPAVPGLQRLRHTVVGIVQARRRAHAESAQGLASAGLLIVAPGLFAVAVAAVDGAAADLYLFEWIGAICVLSGVMGSWLGWWWMNRIVASAMRSAP